MSRRYNEEPVNLIQILPSKEKDSMQNPLKPSITCLLLEATAAGVRGLAELITRGGRRMQLVVGDLSRSIREFSEQGNQWMGWVTLRSRRLGQGLARFGVKAKQWIAVVWDRVGTQTSRLIHEVMARGPEHQKPVSGAQNAPNDELASLRAQLLAQQQELAQVTSQLMELKALAMSQEQVLLYLGKELDAMQMPVVPAAAVAPKKSPNRGKKSAKAKRATSSRTAQKPSISL